jgi:predicted phosphate transport protein (TIGR00153 family)
MVRLGQLFAPKEREFFDLFEEAARNAVKAAELLERLLEQWPDDGSALRAQILDCEHDGDRITHAIIQRLNHSFVTPFEREDIIALASGLDDVVDWIEEVADFLSIYRIEAPMGQAQEMATVLHAAVAEIGAAIPRLRSLKDVHQHTVEVNRLENEGDRILRAALAALFDHDGIDPMVVIRWKDIFERLEHAIDSTETAMNTLEGVVIKNR